MALREIVKYPDERLHEECEAVNDFNQELATLLDDMFETMYEADGIGLAAPQIGVMKRVTVIDVSPDGTGKLELINPEIVDAQGKVSSEEGCLSIPGYRDTIKRNETVKVRAQDRTGEFFEVQAEELLSICLQHEIDHLHGVLFTDKLSRLKREFFKRWFKKNEPL